MPVIAIDFFGLAGYFFLINLAISLFTSFTIIWFIANFLKCLLVSNVVTFLSIASLRYESLILSLSSTMYKEFLSTSCELLVINLIFKSDKFP